MDRLWKSSFHKLSNRMSLVLLLCQSHKILKETVEVVSLDPRAQISVRMCEQIVEVPVPQVDEQLVPALHNLNVTVEK